MVAKRKKKEEIPKGKFQAVLWFVLNHTWKFVALLILIVAAVLIVSVGWEIKKDDKGKWHIKEIKKPAMNILSKPKR